MPYTSHTFKIKCISFLSCNTTSMELLANCIFNVITCFCRCWNYFGIVWIFSISISWFSTSSQTYLLHLTMPFMASTYCVTHSNSFMSSAYCNFLKNEYCRIPQKVKPFDVIFYVCMGILFGLAFGIHMLSFTLPLSLSLCALSCCVCIYGCVCIYLNNNAFVMIHAEKRLTVFSTQRIVMFLHCKFVQITKVI